MREVLVNAVVHTGEEVLVDRGVVIAGGRIADIVPLGALPVDARVRDLGGGVLAPGFIDLQVNGGGGVLFNDAPNVATLRRIAAAHRRLGTTGIFATVITDARSVRVQAVAAVGQALKEGVPGILGLHLEGPAISRARAGVHDPARIAPLDAAERALATALGPRALVTLAPETVEPEAIAALVAAGVHVAAGHTEASWAEMTRGFEAGVRGVTHLFNAMSQLQGREPGAVGAALTDDRVWCAIIADGHHVHDAAVRLAFRAKPAGRLLLVSDAMPPAGSQVAGSQVAGSQAPGSGTLGDFTLYGSPVTVIDGACRDRDGRLAGSALDLGQAVRRCVRHLDIPLDEALRMASTYPAAAVGMDGERGRLAPGLAADLVHLDEDLRPMATWVGGKMNLD